jgi:type II secretory pathway component PulF
MPIYSFTARTNKSRKIAGEMDVVDDVELGIELRKVGLELRSYKQSGGAKSSSSRLLLPYRVPLKELVVIASQLEMYFRLDMRMTETLDAVRGVCGSRRLKRLLGAVRNRIVLGDTLAQALRYYPHAFGHFFIGIMDVGQVSGRYTQVLAHASRHLKWMADFKRHIRRELMAPILAVVFASGLILWLPIYIWHFIAFQDFTLSTDTRKILSRVVSPILMDGWYYCILLPLMLYGIIRLARHVQVLAYVMDGIVLWLPGIGRVVRLYDTLNFSYLYAVMWQAGLTAEQAFGKARMIVANAVLREALEIAEHQIHWGATPSVVLEQSHLFDPMVIKAFALGETTGNFDEALDSVYYFNTRALQDAADGLLWKLRLLCFLIAGFMVLSLAAQVGMHK